MPFVEANGLRFNVVTLGPSGAPDDTLDGAALGGALDDVGDASVDALDPETERPIVVMLHGLIADNLSSYYYTIANPIALAGADVYLYDLRGHGRTETPKSGYTLADNVADLAALLDVWGITRPVHLFGNSFGGAISLAFARAHPERVASLFMIEAHFANEGWGEHMAGSLALAAFGLDEQVTQDWLDNNGGRKVRRLARHAEMVFTETSMIDDLQAEAPFPRADLRAISCPLFAIYGANSDILDRAADLDREVPDSELVIVPDCTHSVLTEATPIVREHALAWMRRVAR